MTGPDVSRPARRETLRQYTARRVHEIAAEYNVSMAEVRRLYPPSWWYGQWFDDIRADAARGEVIDARALDALEPMHRRHIAHDWARSIPAGYVFPEARTSAR